MASKVKFNFIYNLIYHIFIIIVPLITTPYVSRTLGKSGIGDYAFAFSIAHYFSLFIKLGLNNYGNRTIAYSRGNKQKMSSDFWNIYCFQFLVSIVVVSAYLFYCFFLSSNLQISLLFIFYIVSSGIDITWFFWGLEEFKITVTRSIIIKILSTIAIFAFVHDKSDTLVYTFILVVGTFGSQAFLWPRLFRYVKFVKPTKKEVVKHIKPNLLLFLPAIAVSFYKIMDKIMLGILSTKSEVGLYESSEKVLQIPMAIIESLGTVMQPRMSNLVSQNADKNYMRDVLKKSIIVIMFFSTALGFGIMAVADEFVPIFYGEGFEKCALLFKILIPSCIFLAFTNVFKTQYLLPQKKDKEYIVALFTGAAVNTVVNLILIPRTKSAGAAIGTLLAEISVCIVIAHIVNKESRVLIYFSQAIPFVLSGLVMYISGEFIVFNFDSVFYSLALKVIVCGTIYIVTLVSLLFIGDKMFNNNSIKDVLKLSTSLIKGNNKKKT